MELNLRDRDISSFLTISEKLRLMAEGISAELNQEHCVTAANSIKPDSEISFDTLLESIKVECDASGSEPKKLELWRTVADPSKVVEAFYLEGNYYHDIHLPELAKMSGMTHKNVRDTLSRLRKKDEKAGNIIPPPPKQFYEFNDYQKSILETVFKGTRQIDTLATREIMDLTGLTAKQINNWFCNQRRKVDGRSYEKDKKRRDRIKEEMRSKGLCRVPVFSLENVALFECEYRKIKQASESGGKTDKIPYTMLVERTGLDRKKIRDWFSKRKLRGKSISESRENEGNEEWKQRIDAALGIQKSTKTAGNSSDEKNPSFV